MFWDQFNDSVHSKPQFSDPVKLAYLQQALKDGAARHAIEGLSGTASTYCEAVTMLQERYDRLPTPSSPRALDSRSAFSKGWEWQGTTSSPRVLAQHLRVLKVMEYEPGPFATSLIELRLD